MPLMAKKRPDSKRTKGEDRHLKPRLAFHLDQALLDAMERYIATTRPRPTSTAVLIAALEEYLSTRGYYPSPTDNPS
jgi:hypothetical protein